MRLSGAYTGIGSIVKVLLALNYGEKIAQSKSVNVKLISTKNIICHQSTVTQLTGHISVIFHVGNGIVSVYLIQRAVVSSN